MKKFTFLWILIYIYRIAKNSGFVFISIKSEKSKTKLENGKQFLKFILSFTMSVFLAVYTDVYAETMNIIPSKIVEIGLNSMVRVTMLISMVIKLNNWIHRDTFFQFIKKIRWCNKKVNLS
jgi:hypothetical protein